MTWSGDRLGVTLAAALCFAIQAFPAIPAIPAIPANAQGDAVAPLTKSEFERLHRELVPKSTEPWQTIPWKVDLLAARAEAIQSGKPLFLWAMNGHPLGCT